MFVLGGCVYNDEPMPRITYDHSSKIARPRAFLRKQERGTDVSENIPAPLLVQGIPGVGYHVGYPTVDWLPPSQVEKKWIAVVIHHSATKNGSAAIFDKWHKEGHYWEGVGYDFVIGNGTDSGDGQVEVTFRWRNQIIGAHCGGTRGNWANKYAVGICLVGNFNHTTPTMQQMRSVVKLVRFLQNRYGIPKSRIYGHNTTPGTRATDCPGKHFPMAKLKSMLDF